MRKKRITSVITTVGILILIVLIFPFINLFKLKKVIVITDEKEIKGLSELEEENLLFSSAQKIASVLVKQNIKFRSVGVVKIYPSTLILSVELKSYKAKINANNSVLVDEEGILIAQEDVSPTNLPIISVQNIPLALYQKVDWRVGRAITLIDQLEKYGLRDGNVILDGSWSYLKLVTSEGTEITIPDESDVYRAAASLQIIFNRFRIEGKNVKSIDLRFEKPIIILGTGEKISSGFEL